MKAFVDITGQVNGNFTLRNKIAICDGVTEVNNTNYFGYRVYFKTIKQAKQALKQAYHSFIREDPQDKNKLSGYRMIGDERLEYDASSATMFRDKR